MPDLMTLFGISGIIIGPIIAALFIGLWDIYGEAFREYLYPVHICGLNSDEVIKEESDNSPSLVGISYWC